MLRSLLVITLLTKFWATSGGKTFQIMFPNEPYLDTSPIMFPNERSTLDDCDLRYFKLDIPSNKHGAAFGHRTRFREFPHMAAIGWTDPENRSAIQWKCGGSLIWDNIVLTAAHCTLFAMSRAPDVVRLGDLNLFSADDDGFVQQFGIAEIVRHPKHRYSQKYHDIALLKLDRKVSLHETVVPACLWSDQEVRFRELIATGWGSTGHAQEHSPYLLKVMLKPMDIQQCSSYYPASRKYPEGLKSQHLCAVDEKMDTCEGDSGGPLQVKLLHNSRMTPFLVGVTSFGSSCGLSSPGVYTRISEYHDWIIASMRQLGAVGIHESYNETLCALRFAEYREFDEQVATNARIKAGSAPDQMVKLGWINGGKDCYGVIVDEDTVLTIADCAELGGIQPTFITYLGNKTMNITKIHVHPKHVRGSGYNNIAILKLSKLLDLPLEFQPSCIDHNKNIEAPFNVYGFGRLDINKFLAKDAVTLDPTELIHIMRPPIINKSDCIVSECFRARLSKGLRREHLCVGNDVFQVPRSCDLLVGSVLDEWRYKGDNNYHHTMALALFGRDCGFGEHLIATKLVSHVGWLKSVLLPDQGDTSNVAYFVDRDLIEGNNCQIDNRAGICVKIDHCWVPRENHIAQGLTTFCTTSSVICCPLEITGRKNNTFSNPDILNCPNMATSYPRPTSEGSLASFGWKDHQTILYRGSGTIITRFMVLTTASCLRNSIPDLIQPVNSRQHHAVDTVRTHPGFNSIDHTNDIALVRLVDPFDWSPSVFPACLYSNQSHTPIVMKMIRPLGPLTDIETTLLHPMYNSDCQRALPYRLQSSQLCARNPRSLTTCLNTTEQLYWTNFNQVTFVVGLATSTVDCDIRKQKYLIFTRISAHLKWISENI